MKRGLHEREQQRVTIAGVFGATCAAGELQQATFRAFDAAVHPSDSRKLVLIL